MSIVSARQKPVDQLPEWTLCCDTMRQLLLVEEKSGRIVKVESGTAFSGELECHHCRQITKNIRYLLTIAQPKQLAIAVDCFDFDEGANLEEVNGNAATINTQM